MPTEDRELTDYDRVILTEVMDRLVPPVGDLPGAGGLDLRERLERISQRVPRLRKALIMTLDAFSLDVTARAEGGFAAMSPEAQDKAIRVVEGNMPEQFTGLLELVYEVYYTDSRVHEHIGWVGRPPQPEGFEMEPWDESILNNIRNRKPFWRKA
ncbi:MAG: gluconate 2-dehydrogenase subunit 3 family protein [Chloroflexota bacterium]